MTGTWDPRTEIILYAVHLRLHKKCQFFLNDAEKEQKCQIFSGTKHFSLKCPISEFFSDILTLYSNNFLTFLTLPAISDIFNNESDL